MPCTNPDVPVYLHYDEKRKKYQDIDFESDQSLYRLTNDGNPIEFPSTCTAYSCNWSFIIRETDNLKVPHKEDLNSYRTALIGKLRSVIILKEKPEDPYRGWHKLSCVFDHAPNDCNYSHSEVLIKHQIFKDAQMLDLSIESVYTYSDWQNKCLLTKGGLFKELRSDYRLSLIKLFL